MGKISDGYHVQGALFIRGTVADVRFDHWDLKRCYPLPVLIFVINKPWLDQWINWSIKLFYHFIFRTIFFFFFLTYKNLNVGNSLAVQWLGFSISIAKALSLIPGWGIKILQAMQHSQPPPCKKKKERNPDTITIIEVINIFITSKNFPVSLFVLFLFLLWWEYKIYSVNSYLNA